MRGVGTAETLAPPEPLSDLLDTLCALALVFTDAALLTVRYGGSTELDWGARYLDLGPGGFYDDGTRHLLF